MLVADDTTALREMFRLLLEGDGFDVAEASDGLDAIEKARRFQPNVVLLDLAMPKMDGLEALEGIGNVAPQAKIVVLTGIDYGPIRELAMEKGATKFLVKGVQPPSSLVEVVRSLVP